MIENLCKILNSNSIMEIDASLFNILVNCYAIKESPTFKFNESGKSVVLDSDATKFMENGLIAAKFLTYITLFIEKQQNGKRLGINIDKLQTLKVNSTSNAKLYNWNTLEQEIKLFDIQLTSEEKLAIVEGDHQSIISLLGKLKELLSGDTKILSEKNSEEKQPSEKPKGISLLKGIPKMNNKIAKEEDKENINAVPKAAVDIEEIQTEKNPNECIN